MLSRIVPLIVLLALASLTYAAGTIVQIYECPICHKIAEYAEDSAKIHNCTGSEEKPHTKVVMVHRGKREVGSSRPVIFAWWRI